VPLFQNDQSLLTSALPNFGLGVKSCCSFQGREAFGVRGACSRFRTRSDSRKREQAPRTPNASRLWEQQKLSTACPKLGNTPSRRRLRAVGKSSGVFDVWARGMRVGYIRLPRLCDNGPGARFE